MTDLDLEYGQGQGQVPLSHTQLPYNSYSPPIGHFMAPHRCPHCEDIPDDIFPLPPYSVTNPDPPPHYDDLFPLVTPHSLTPTPTYASVSLQYPPLQSP